jgi:hypothetical protein
MAQHSSLASGRWFELSLFEQLGNIGSEVGRTFKTTDPEHRQAAAYRALELFDLTLADSRWRGRGSELARSREVFCDFVFGDNQYNSDAVSLEKYFMQFAIVARR